MTEQLSAHLAPSQGQPNKVRKYQHLPKQIQDLTNAGCIRFADFPLDFPEWFYENSELLQDLGLSKRRQRKTAVLLASRMPFTSVDIVQMFGSKAGSAA